MTSGWSLYVAAIVILNVVGSAWLLFWARTRTVEDKKPGETMGHEFDGIEEYDMPLPRWWLWLFVGTIVFLVGYLVVYPGMGNYAGTSGWTSAGQHAEEVREAEAVYGPMYAALAAKPIPELAMDAKAVTIGQRLFVNNCSQCHGSDAQGGPGFPNLTDGDWLFGGEPETIETTILGGRMGQLIKDGPEVFVADVEGKIERLGQVNLAAIDEFKEQSERKEYLDKQFADLTEALNALESAIRKIDRETRERFQDTFDKVNAGLGAKFPRLFGGGNAYLELTGEDVLESGVAVMARPPGKRNSTISQLSGGEKALTAVALVFSIFDLNPAPFCLLDEVDAPLDEHNVGRFCDIVREMSERVQFVFITHNKITMELASQLVGVTMNEPGVSRLVSVDVDEALRLAAVG